MKRACPLCRRVAIKQDNQFWPMCSERCHLVDLGQWLSEQYRIPEEPDASGGGVESVTPTDDER